ncbi:Ribonucleoside-diphosphate reductase subunit alpha [Tritrichomonas foetus]|uniref:Ribonucleoside-diphosphate reductase n=1 Tax=Tritrichomonas foetus TaxID=1144522 RepID=A0A1J4K7N1_9EUKA|nr:Ribonucleoside-diphosphate reductase subunit alpha [Tritrichomonas foetus]|eukprot:OHT06896.1 Ribonucleoside-diphosphate reductase subunit alpha [Tritrichomonas foetus]
MFVVKRRTNAKQEFDIKKIEQTIEAASANLTGISQSKIIDQAAKQIFNGISTKQIQKILIKITSDFISEDNSNYQYVAGNLMINKLRKDVWNSSLPTESLYQRIKYRAEALHIYDPIILEKFTENEVNLIENEIVKYERDYILTYSGVRQFNDKYLVQNRKTKDIFELPQEANILVCMYMFKDKDKEPNHLRFNLIKQMYDKLSTFVISLPTPIYSGVRTNMRQFSSCCVLDCGDNMNSILSSNYIIGLATSKRYGIGLNVGRIRGNGASISNGTVIHPGIVPLLKMFEATTKGFVKDGVRGGGGTISFPFWHWEVQTLLELKNNKGVAENRVRSLDYSIGLNKFFLSKALKNEMITLFSSEDVPLLTNDYRHTHEEFINIYTNYENMEGIRKKKILALDLLKKIATERFETGRIYVYFMDNMNHYGVFKESIFCSNLCQEIALPTVPATVLDGKGLISVCILSCINVGRLQNFKELEEICEICVRFLDEMIDYQEYDFPQIKESAEKYRPLGIGVSDLFHLLARNHLVYNSQECLHFVHRLFEHFQFYLLKASCLIAKEKGKCECFDRSKYSSGYLPIDSNSYKKSIDSFGVFPLECDWENLRKNIKQYGLRNTCLSAIPPTASSSSISNSTPGIDPPKSPVTTKMSKYGTFKQIPPEYELYKDFYTFQKDINTTEYFKMIGIIQKFIDQGISTNSFYLNEKEVSLGDVIKEITTAYSYGLKSLYYLNSNKGTDNDVRAVMSKTGIKAYSHDDLHNANDDSMDGCAGGSCQV